LLKKLKIIERITLHTFVDEIQRNIELFSLHKPMQLKSFSDFIENLNENNELRKNRLGKLKEQI